MDDFAAHLPVPREDEPDGLRRDIADELADHLECAVRREQSRAGGDDSPTVAAAAAIERFGDPHRVARKLWWDAMKERIMAQRVVSVMATAVAVVAILSSVLLWRALADTRAEQAALFESQRQSLAALIDRLPVSAPAPVLTPAKNDAWQRLRVMLFDTHETSVQGEVHISGTPLFGPEENRLATSAKVGAEGFTAFNVPVGKYAVFVNIADEWTSFEALVSPDTEYIANVICPRSGDLAPSPARFKVATPDEAAEQPLYYLVELRRGQLEFHDRTWMPRSDNPQRLLIDRSGRVLGQLPADAETNAGLPPPLMTYDLLKNQVTFAFASVDWSRTVEAGSSQSPQLIAGGNFPTTLTPKFASTEWEGLLPATYTIRLSPYVPQDSELRQRLVAGEQLPDGEIPPLRALWGNGCYTQDSFNAAAPNEIAYTIDRRLIDWKQLLHTIDPVLYPAPPVPNLPYPQPQAPASPSAAGNYSAPYAALPYATAAPPVAQSASPDPNSGGSPAPYAAPSTYAAPAEVKAPAQIPVQQSGVQQTPTYPSNPFAAPPTASSSPP